MLLLNIMIYALVYYFVVEFFLLQRLSLCNVIAVVSKARIKKLQ